MPDTKNFSLRVKVLDGLLRNEDGVSMKQMLRVVNNRLDEKGIKPIKTKDTILKDLTELANEHCVRIVRRKDKSDSRIIKYRYADTDFSIYRQPLDCSDIQEIRFAQSLASSINGHPLCKWIRRLCERYGISCNDRSLPCIEFESSVDKRTMKALEYLFRAIIEKNAITISVRMSDDNETQHVVHPYLLKQFDRRWYLVAMDSKRQDSLGVFPLERLLSFNRNTNVRFIPNRFESDMIFSNMYGVTIPDKKKTIYIVFRVYGEQMQDILDFPIHKSQKLIRKTRHSATMSITVIPNDDLVRKFLSLSGFVTVISDCDLRKEIIKRLKLAIKKYESST